MAPATVAERLQRLLALVPYVVRHPGTSFEELTRLFGVDETDLTADLNLLFVTGLPPYGPGDLVDVEMEGGRVWIRMAEQFSRPVRLTRSEALALYLRGTALLGSEAIPQSDALRSALAKLEDALGEEALGELRAEVGEAPHRPGPLEAVRDAAATRTRIEIDYYSANRDEVATRRVDPEQVFSAIGNWYVVAWDHRSDEERLFRVDRIRSVRATGETFEPRGLLGHGRDLYTGSEDDIEVRLRLAPEARWVAEYYRTDDVDERGDAVVVTIPTKDLRWVAKLVLRLGGAATIESPPELRDLTRELAERTLRLYG